MTLVLDILFAASVAAIVGYLIISNILLRIKNKSLFVKAAQAEVDRVTVYEQAKQIFATEYEKASSNDGFIKFMTTSRDWAFEYIEKVQQDLYNLKIFYDYTGSAPKTVAQANELNKLVSKVLENLPEDDKKNV